MPSIPFLFRLIAVILFVVCMLRRPQGTDPVDLGYLALAFFAGSFLF